MSIIVEPDGRSYDTSEVLDANWTLQQALEFISEHIHIIADRECLDIANRIAGPRGEKPRLPDPVQIAEDAERIFRAALECATDGISDASMRGAWVKWQPINTLPAGRRQIALVYQSWDASCQTIKGRVLFDPEHGGEFIDEQGRSYILSENGEFATHWAAPFDTPQAEPPLP